MARGGAGRGQGRKPIGDAVGEEVRTRIDKRHARRLAEVARELGVPRRELCRRILEHWSIGETWIRMGP